MTEAEFRDLVKRRMARRPGWTLLFDASSNTKMPSGLIGVADLLFAAPGPALVFLETKGPGKKRSPAQIRWFKKLESYLCWHIRYVCTDNWEDWADAVSDLM